MNTSTKIESLKNCQKLSDLAHLLGYKPSAISYILYKINPDEKYTSFEIPKKTGGIRTIHAPCDRLKKLQRSLANLLYDCQEDIKPKEEKIGTIKCIPPSLPSRKRLAKSISHGYEKGLSISTNADMHINSRHVFNIDMQDFFPSFNFGRVRGFFIKNKSFKLHPRVATIIAQIACYENSLPQGSPCSPVISNLITKSLDISLLRLAKKYKCIYTRYVDDITISTNSIVFPPQIAYKKIISRKWCVGYDINNEIAKHGFKINTKKCRMQNKNSRQEVTGLTVNKYVNVSSAYYRNLRSICNELFSKGVAYKKPLAAKQNNKFIINIFNFITHLFSKKIAIKNETPQEAYNLTIDQIHGMLVHVYNIKSYRNKFASPGYRKHRHDGIRTKKDNESKYPPPE